MLPHEHTGLLKMAQSLMWVALRKQAVGIEQMNDGAFGVTFQIARITGMGCGALVQVVSRTSFYFPGLLIVGINSQGEITTFNSLLILGGGILRFSQQQPGLQFVGVVVKQLLE